MVKKIEFISAIQILTWGLWVLLPFDSFSSAQVSHILTHIGSEWMWGIFATLVGVLWLLVKKLKLRAILAVISMVFWTVISFTYILSNYNSTATGAYPVAVFIASMAFSEINKEAKWM